MLPALMASAHWTRARTAAAHPDTRPLGASGAPTSTMTAGETAMLASWDANGDGKLTKDDLTDADTAAANTVPDDQRRAMGDALDPFVHGAQLDTGWLAAMKSAVGASASMSFRAPYRAAAKILVVNSTNSDGRTWLSLPIGGLPTFIPGNAATAGGVVLDAAGQVVDAVTPWADGLARALSVLNDATFWKRVGVVVLGVGLVAGAVALTVKDFTPAGIAAGAAGRAVGSHS